MFLFNMLNVRKRVGEKGNRLDSEKPGQSRARVFSLLELTAIA
jgi:hypothetical protein